MSPERDAATRTVSMDVPAGTSVTVTAECSQDADTATSRALFTADAAPPPPVDAEISGLDDDTATPQPNASSVDIADMFSVAPAPTDITTPPTTTTPTPPTTTTPTANSDDCDTPLGALTAATPPTTGTLAATDGCTSTRHPRKTATSTYQARRHTFTLNSPGWVTITLESAATNTQRIDTYLVLLRGHTPDGTGTYITHNDDAQNAASHGLHWRDSRLVDVFLRPGHYTIEATTYHAHSTTNPARTTGDYDLTVEATLTGLQASYDAVVDETLAIGFETGDYVARVQSISPPTLDWSTGRTGSRSSLAVTADMADTHRVVLTLAKPSPTAASQARSASSTSSTMSTVEFDVAAACGTGLAASDRNGHLCVRAAAQASTTNYPEDRVTETGRGRKYPVTLGTLWGVKKVAKDARDAYMNPSPGTTRACTPTANRIAAIMLSIPLWEVPRSWWIDDNNDGQQQDDEFYVQRDPGRSPMAVSRKDLSTALHSNNSTSPPDRAFWHPGVGLWQLDDTWANPVTDEWRTRHLSHGDRAEIGVGGQVVAEYLAEALCTVSEGGMESAINSALQPWLACQSNSSRTCYRLSYLKLWVKRTDDLHVTSYSTEFRAYNGTHSGGAPVVRDHRNEFSTSGGLSRLKCRWGSGGVDFDCWFYDTDNEEGWMQDDNVSGITGDLSPLAAPFMSFTHDNGNGDKRFAVFPESFLGTQTTLIKAVPVETNVRDTSASSWTPGRFGRLVLQVEICRVVAVEAGSVCEWVSTTLNSGPRTFAQKIRDAGH
ncbi:DVUA0089 family protein [Candidatus Poriferisodalis sp.]|uniref:DVUA0089 family protein n=1 Tax=Candidatus Poriferisodalis sp. TaxID=3101277 RepID=UPI003AF689FA